MVLRVKMAEIRKLRSTKRFGPRYGATVKRRFDKIERSQRRLHKCPYCHFVRAKRIASGIWLCKKCKAKFTGKAYSISKPITKVVEEPEIAEEKGIEEEKEAEEKEETKKEVKEEKKTGEKPKKAGEKEAKE